MKDAGSLLDAADALVQQNRIPEAKQLYQEVIRLEPGNPDAWFMLGLVEQEQSNAALAEAHLRRAIEFDDKFPEAHLNLANLLRKQARIDEAKHHARHAAQLSEDYAEAWLLLGGLELESREYASAQASFRHALRYWPENAGLHANLGHCQAALGELPDAKASFNRAIALGAASADEYLALARVELRLQQFAEALRSAAAARDKSPARSDIQQVLANAMIAAGRAEDALPILNRLGSAQTPSADVWFAMGNAHHALEDFEKAREAYEKACRERPDSALFQTALATVESQLGRFGRVAEICRRVLAVQPGHEEAQLLLAGALSTMGDFSDAISLYRAILQRRPDHDAAVSGLMETFEKTGDVEAGRALLGGIDEKRLRENPSIALAAAKLHAHVGQNEEAIRILASVLESVDSRKMEKDTNILMGIHNQLGKLLDREGRYAEAFSHFSASNRLRSPSFVADAHVQEIDRIIARWQPADVSAAAASGNLSDQPLFIVGMPRSGSTLAEQILSSHPLVTAGGELQIIPQIAERLSGESGCLPYATPHCKTLTRQQLAEASEAYLELIAGIGGDARYVTDKLPYNYLHLGLISLLFPKAKIIHCTRSPLDTCISNYVQNFSGPRGFAANLEAIGTVYQQYQRVMAHWLAFIPNRVFELSYEVMVENQELTTRSLLEFCELPWDERCLAFQDNRRTALTASYNQVRQPMYRHSVERWRHYEAYLGGLVDLLGKPVQR